MANLDDYLRNRAEADRARDVEIENLKERMVNAESNIEEANEKIIENENCILELAEIIGEQEDAMLKSAMVDKYVKLISSGTVNDKTGEPWKIEDVPARWQDAVREALENEMQ